MRASGYSKINPFCDFEFRWMTIFEWVDFFLLLSKSKSILQMLSIFMRIVAHQIINILFSPEFFLFKNQIILYRDTLDGYYDECLTLIDWISRRAYIFISTHTHARPYLCIRVTYERENSRYILILQWMPIYLWNTKCNIGIYVHL